MSSGRTSWWPRDSVEHGRELVVELAEEFGPAAHAVTGVLKDLAQQQRQDDGALRHGFRGLAQLCHLEVQEGSKDAARALARRIVERAGEIGFLDDLVIDGDGRRFSCRPSGWAADSVRGRAAIRKAMQRREDPDSDEPSPTSTGRVPSEGDNDSSQSGGTRPNPVGQQASVSHSGVTETPAVTSSVTLSRSVPLTEHKQSRTEKTAAAADARTNELAATLTVDLAALAVTHSLASPTLDDVTELLADHPTRDLAAALRSLQKWVKRDCPDNLLAALRHVLESAPELAPALRPVTVTPATPADMDAWMIALNAMRELVGDSNYEIWIGPLILAGRTDAGVFVLDCDPAIEPMVADRYSNVLTTALGDQAWQLRAAIPPERREMIRDAGKLATQINESAKAVA